LQALDNERLGRRQDIHRNKDCYSHFLPASSLYWNPLPLTTCPSKKTRKPSHLDLSEATALVLYVAPGAASEGINTDSESETDDPSSPQCSQAINLVGFDLSSDRPGWSPAGSNLAETGFKSYFIQLG
jgi:hypothetical protein